MNEVPPVEEEEPRISGEEVIEVSPVLMNSLESEEGDTSCGGGIVRDRER